MKKLLCILFTIIISLFTVNVAFAHSGGTDYKGGHWDGDEYHYHHGYSAHQHKNGECPYGFDDAVEYKKSNTSNKRSSSTKTNQNQSSFMVKIDDDYEWRFSDYLLLMLSIVLIAVLGFYSVKMIHEDYQDIEWNTAFYIVFLWAATSIILICYSLSFEFVKYNEDRFVTQWVLCIFIMLTVAPVLYILLSIAYWLLWHALSLLLQFIKFIAKHTMPILKEIFDKEFQRAIIITGSILLVALIGRLLSEIWN